MMNNANNVNDVRVGYDEVASVDTPDAARVVFHLKRPVRARRREHGLAEATVPVAIVPEHLLPDIRISTKSRSTARRSVPDPSRS